jgi:hypothetical protein
MISVFEQFRAKYGLVSEAIPSAICLEHQVLADDKIAAIDLETLKKYLRVDGSFEDDLLLLLLRAAVVEIEKRNNVSISGKHIKAWYSWGKIDITQLPFANQIENWLVCEIQNSVFVFEYTTKPNENEAEFYKMEVLALCEKRYNERGAQHGKRIFV